METYTYGSLAVVVVILVVGGSGEAIPPDLVDLAAEGEGSAGGQSPTCVCIIGN